MSPLHRQGLLHFKRFPDAAYMTYRTKPSEYAKSSSLPKSRRVRRLLERPRRRNPSESTQPKWSFHCPLWLSHLPFCPHSLLLAPRDTFWSCPASIEKFLQVLETLRFPRFANKQATLAYFPPLPCSTFIPPMFIFCPRVPPIWVLIMPRLGVCASICAFLFGSLAASSAAFGSTSMS